MNKTVKKANFLAIMSAMLLTGCATGAVKTGWVSSSHDQEMQATYSTFSGTETGYPFSVENGQTIALAYEVNMEKGNLTIAVEELNGESLWTKESTSEDGTLRENVQIPTSGDSRYRISVRGADAGGGYHIQWSLDG